MHIARFTSFQAVNASLSSSRALVAEAEILILDEPTSALDLKNQTLILDWIARLSRDNSLTIVMTTHHPHHALAVAGRVHLMLGDANHIVGRPESVLTEENLIALYGVPMKRVEFDYEGQHFETLAHVLPNFTFCCISEIENRSCSVLKCHLKNPREASC